MGTWALSECMLLVSVGCFEFWFLYVCTDVMQVYAVGADGHVLSCLSGLPSFIRAVFSYTQTCLPDLVQPRETNPCNAGSL
jgi:hypothetical protein